MPRIAVAIMVIVTVGISIGINTARFPVVWEMVSTHHVKPLPKELAPAPMPSVSCPAEAVDLSSFAPPATNDSSSDMRAPIRVPQSPTPEAPDSEGNDVQSAYPFPGSDPTHLVSEPLADVRRQPGGLETGTSGPLEPTTDGPDYAGMDHGQNPDEPPAESSSSENASSERPLHQTPAPIVFGLPARAPSNATLNISAANATGPNHGAARPAATGAVLLPAGPTTWPARMVPSLKFAAKPPIADVGLHDWRTERPLVPIVWPDQGRSATVSTPGALASSIERLPKVEPTDQAAPWKELRRLPASPIPIYPSTGQ